MEKKTIVITGASDGIGAAAARQLKALGHHVVIVGRTKEKTEKVARELNAPYHLADYTDLSQVRRLAEELRRYDRIDVLANNAGGAQSAKQVTADGFEKTFQINYLAAFLLTNLLMEKLCACRATVIQTSSVASNLFGAGLDLDDLNYEKSYLALKAYGEAKLENVLFARELYRRFGERGLSAVAFEPGLVRSNFASESVLFLKVFYRTPLKYVMTITPDRSARRLVRLAVGEPGKDFRCGEVYSYERTMPLLFQDRDGSAARQLWDNTEQLLAQHGVQFAPMAEDTP